MSQPNYITPAGFAALQAAHHQLFDQERPKMVEVVSWAAGNGDRSENGDYIYGRKRLREIDRELNRLAKRMKDAQVVDPRRQPDKQRVRSEEHTSELQSLMRISYAVFCLKKKKQTKHAEHTENNETKT